MPTPSELLKGMHSTLTSLIEHFDVIDKAEERATNAKAQLDATALEYKQASTQLQGVKSELAKAESDLQSKRHLINDEAARALQSTQSQIAARQEELKKLEAQVKAARQEHDNIVASMQALSQRLRV